MTYRRPPNDCVPRLSLAGSRRRRLSRMTRISCHNGAMVRIAIVGVGAIGAVIAASLQVTERHELILCTRRPLPHLNVETPEGSININYSNLTAPSQAQPVDWVIVATKAYDAPGAGAWVEHLCKQGAPIAVIQTWSGTSRALCSLCTAGADRPCHHRLPG
jgi:ketopantoate reductase